jgi:hypothetical protein
LAQPGRTPAPPDRWDPPVSGNFLSHAARALSLSLAAQCGQAIGVGFFASAPLLSLSAPCAFPVSSALPALAVDQRARTRARRWDPRPRRSAQAPSPF